MTEARRKRSGKVHPPNRSAMSLTPGEPVVLKVARELLEDLLNGDDIDCEDTCTE